MADNINHFHCYSITNKISGSKYIGISSKKFGARWSNHKTAARRGVKNKLYCAMRKYGFDSFLVEKIGYADSWEDLCDLEVYLIDLYDTYKCGYNLTLGGEGFLGLKLSKEHKEKISLAGKGRIVSDEQRKNMSGNRHTDETKKKISNALKGKKRTPEMIKRLSNAHKGHFPSEETRKKLSKATTAYWARKKLEKEGALNG